MTPQRATERAQGPKRESSGFILIVVLWILAALAALASTYSVYAINAALATRVDDDRLQIKNAISTGVELAAYKLLADDKPQGAFAVRLAHSSVKVAFASESARVDLNAAPKALLAGVFTAVGVSSSDAATFAERIAGWRKPPDAGDQNAEAGAYKVAGYEYAPRQGPFQNTLELRLVLGIPPYIVERVLPLVTVYSGVAQIDVRVAPIELLSALPNITSDQLQRVLAQRKRNPTDGQAMLSLLGSAGALADAKANSAARVQAQIRLDNGRSAGAEVVIFVLKDDEEPYRVPSLGATTWTVRFERTLIGLSPAQ